MLAKELIMIPHQSFRLLILTINSVVKVILISTKSGNSGRLHVGPDHHLLISRRVESHVLQ